MIRNRIAFGRTVCILAGLTLSCAVARSAVAQVETNLDNFFLNGTQPQENNPNFMPFSNSEQCTGCHQGYSSSGNYEIPIFDRWQGSMKANAARDPVWHAALAIANQDAPMSGDLCIRCHSPAGWLGGRSVPTDGSALGGDLKDPHPEDYEGVTCTVCHRMVDPIARAGNPPQDDPIRNALINAGMLPTSYGGGNFVVDPDDVRRGPFPFDPNINPNPYPNVRNNFHGVPIIESPLHRSANMCGTCHDVSDPVLTRQPDGSYVPNAPGVAHPTQNKYDMFPVERTFSEWSNSQFASTGVQMNGIFGGNHPTGVMSQCQDCHMPDTDTYACFLEYPGSYPRPNVPAHDFSGGNTWVQDIIANLYFDVDPQNLMDAKDRARYMLQHAAELEVTSDACDINVRIINNAGHKLPTGYPEGRRMWINVDFLDQDLNVVASRGYYDGPTADLSTSDTKVYEVQLGLDAAMASASGVPEGPSFHFVLNNKVFKDNRIPPRGFNNAAFASVQAAPVGGAYEDGQYWDDTQFRVPPGAVSATVSIYYQTASKEYIEFLRDENVTNDAGDDLYVQWQFTGMSPPVLMKQQSIQGLTPGLLADADCSGTVDLSDTASLADCLTGPSDSLHLGCELFDADLDGDVDLADVLIIQSAFMP